ncbi:ABC transporter ATP-binding protein [Clostridia bacterium]|nr:ABC transporter ATP-binding protein [Clostridia bacterium]
MLKPPYLRGFTIDKPLEEEYLRNIPAIKHLRSFTFHAPVTIFAGENGSGKSTLLEALAVHCGFNPEGGTRNFNFATSETHSKLYKSIRLTRSIPFPSEGFFLRAESYYNVATEIDRLKDRGLNDGESFMRHYGGKSLHEQSHGESFMALVTNRFGGNSIFFLDEPEAALSPARQLALLARIYELAREDSQFIIATHSPILMACPGAEVYELTEEGAALTPYGETANFTLMKQFVEAPDRMLHYLLEDMR